MASLKCNQSTKTLRPPVSSTPENTLAAVNCQASRKTTFELQSRERKTKTLLTTKAKMTATTQAMTLLMR